MDFASESDFGDSFSDEQLKDGRAQAPPSHASSDLTFEPTEWMSTSEFKNSSDTSYAGFVQGFVENSNIMMSTMAVYVAENHQRESDTGGLMEVNQDPLGNDDMDPDQFNANVEFVSVEAEAAHEVQDGVADEIVFVS
jgi:hypothetical protein